MIILEHPLENALNIIGYRTLEPGVQYRPCRFNLMNEEPEGMVVINGLTKAAVLIRKKEWEEIMTTHTTDLDFLVHSYILVPEDFDEQEAARYYRETLYNERVSNIEHPSNYTILPTTSCNARCFYCYEHGCVQKVMSKETAEKVAKFIIEHGNHDNPTRIHWFGGEPTVNINAMNTICDGLAKAGIDYYSEITSNGYLLNKKNLDYIKNVWKLRSAQITIDGTEKVYNEAKNYVYKDGPSPYKVVLENVGMLLSNDISVNVRLNVGPHNAHDLKELINVLDKKFHKHRLLTIYAMPLFECAMVEKRTPEERKEVYQWVSDIYDLLYQLGYVRGSIDRGMYNTMCFADDGRSLLIAPGGDIGLCEHHVNDDFIATVDDPTYNYEIVEKWAEQMTKLPICEDCFFWPNCIKLTHCAEQFSCSEEEKELKIKKEIMHMKNYFRGAKNAPYYKQQLPQEATHSNWPMNQDNNGAGQSNGTRNELLAEEIMIKENGTFVAPQNKLYHTVKVDILNQFLCVKFNKMLYIYPTIEDMEGFGVFTVKDFVKFLNEKTNLAKYNIKEEDVEITSLEGDIKIDGVKIPISKYKALKYVEEFAWEDGEIYGGNLEVEKGNSKIIIW